MFRKNWYILFVLLVLGLYNSAFAQYENVWAFGNHAGIDFNSGSAVAIQTEIDASEGCVSVCNDTGGLLFYTEGSIVWNRRSGIMSNGTNLTGQPQFVQGWRNATVSTAQGGLIVPMIDSPDKYYVFSLSARTVGGATVGGVLYYSIVDMRLNNGLGNVEADNRGIVLDSGLSEKMIAVPGDNCNIWLVVHANDSATFKSYEITASGINKTPLLSKIGYLPPGYGRYCCGTIKSSPNRKKIVNTVADVNTAIELFDFDIATGALTNMQILDTNEGHYSSAFSPDNTKLYATKYSQFSMMNIVQYDLSKPTFKDVINSRTIVSTPGVGYFLGTDFKCGPDGKMYLCNPDAAGLALDVIRYPNLAGAACQFVPNGLQLVTPFTNAADGLPNAIPILTRDTIVNVKNVVADCFQDSVLLEAIDPGLKHKWDNALAGTKRSVSQSGIYWVKYIGYHCTYHIDTFHVSIFPMPRAASTGTCSGLSNGTAWILPTAGDTTTYSYTWQDTAGTILQTHVKRGGDTLQNIAAGTYAIHVIKNATCDVVLSVAVPTLNYEVSFKSDSLICQHDTMAFINTSDNINNRWVWDFGDCGIDTVANPKHSYVRYGAYIVTLKALPCFDSFRQILIVDTTPYIHFTIDKESICEGAEINFTSQYGAGTQSIIWDFGDNTQATGWEQAHAYAHAGQVIIRLTAENRVCPDALYSDTVTVYPYPLVNIGPDTTFCAGQPSRMLTNLQGVPEAYAYLWSTGATTPVITIDTHGEYWLQATTGKGCVAADTIQIDKGCYIAIPNVFSPNADDINDYFFPREILSRGASAFRMSIYNRWGQLVFETSKTDGRGWDGTFNDIPQLQGVYVYLIEMSYINGAQEKYKGNVTLLR